jgi:preprotein translocase SecE subunit
VFGAVVVLGGLFVAGYFVPTLWDTHVAPRIGKDSGFLNAALRLLAQLVAAAAIIWTGTRLAGTHPPKGLRGGIFLVISIVFTLFFVIRAIGLNLNTSSVGPMVTAGIGLLLTFLAVRFLLGDKANRYMIDLEHAGWFHTHSYKHTQGVALRRYTLLGILVMGGTGVYSLVANRTIPYGTLALRIPFTGDEPYRLPLLPAAEMSLPLLLGAAVLWFGWRMVNVPAFADFLINTEAEMNKVSWSTRKRLFQDTIVVLVTVVLLTVFLLVIDLFWGWLLSRQMVGVLPSNTATPTTTIQNQSEW